jgi:serine/threonine protein kinase
MSRINSHYLRKLHLEISIMKVSTVCVCMCVCVCAFLVHVWVCDWAHLMLMYFLPFLLPSSFLSFLLFYPLTFPLSLFLSSHPLQEVDHPNIIKLREVFFGSRTVYLVMELCQGGELFDEITHNAQRGLGEVRVCVFVFHILLV